MNEVARRNGCEGKLILLLFVFGKQFFHALTRTWNVSAEAFGPTQDLSVEAAAAQDVGAQPQRLSLSWKQSCSRWDLRFRVSAETLSPSGNAVGIMAV